MTPGRVTLATVAEALGVSTMTVSNAYNRPEKLSAELRERILAKADELGYAGPDALARSLRRGRTGVLGVVLGEALTYAFEDPATVEFFRGLASAGSRCSSCPRPAPMTTRRWCSTPRSTRSSSTRCQSLRDQGRRCAELAASRASGALAEPQPWELVVRESTASFSPPVR